VSDRGSFLEALRSRPILLDGGMGTRLIARGLDLKRENTSSWILSRPDQVCAIHDADLSAGSEAILTNTFDANRHGLSPYGLDDRVGEINLRAVALARRCAGSGRFVLGDLGYCPAPKALAEQAAILLDCGVDALILETITNREIADAIEAMGVPAGIPLLVSVYAWERGEHRLTSWLIDRGVSAIGVNCRSCEEASFLLEEIREDVPEGFPLLVKPSASDDDYPPRPPATFAALVPRWLELGARLLGGCCWTTEAHVAAMRSAIDEARAGPLL
jgi:methionine synthase I (cobalamin-dependent)